MAAVKFEKHLFNEYEKGKKSYNVRLKYTGNKERDFDIRWNFESDCIDNKIFFNELKSNTYAVTIKSKKEFDKIIKFNNVSNIFA